MLTPFTGVVPGPLGKFPGSGSGRVAGPTGLLWDKQTTQPAVNTTASSPIMTIMPGPANDQMSKDLHEMPEPLYESSSKVPAYTDVQQAPNIANCPVAAILAALAFTKKGQEVITGMLSEKSGSVLTDLSNVPADALVNTPAHTRTVGGKLMISSSRYFTVQLGSGPIDVSDVLYTNDSDHEWAVLYLRNPNGKAIWGSVIEKALAVQLKSYENFDTKDFKPEEFWKRITGKDPGYIAIDANTPLSTIQQYAQNSTKTPTLGATKDADMSSHDISSFHGFAMVGFKDGKVQLYDAAKAQTIPISLANFRHDFANIYFSK